MCGQRGSKTGIKGKNLVSFVCSHPGFGVFSNAFFKEICFPLEADHFHPFKRDANFLVSLVAKGNEESVSAELDVVTHHGQVHPKSLTGRASKTNSISMLTALLMMSVTRAAGRFLLF